GNLFVNASLKAGEGEISKCLIGLPQASALSARTQSSAWVKSVAQGACLNEPKFSIRVMATASGSPGDAYLGAENEMYRPVEEASFNTATVAIAPLSVTTAADPVVD